MRRPSDKTPQVFCNSGDLEPKALGPLPDEKAGNPYHNISKALNYRQPDKLANQNQGDFLYPERTRDKEASTSACHAEAFDDHAFGRADRVAQCSQIYVDGEDLTTKG